MHSILDNKVSKLILRTFKDADKAGIIHNYLDAGVPVTGKFIQLNDKKLINFSSCSYLGFESDSRVIQGICDAATKYGSTFCMSRTYASSSLYGEFESLLGKIFDAYPVVTLSSTLASLSMMNVFISGNDIVLCDEHVHESVHLAASTTLAKNTKVEVMPHNDMDFLESYLEKHKSFSGNIWYCADGIYSMSGDLMPVAKIKALLDKYENLYCYVDDAHGSSIHGKNGRGYVLGEGLGGGQQHPKMIVLVSFVKAFGMGIGAAVIFPVKEWCHHFQVCGPTVRYNTPISPAMLGGGIELAKIHLTDEIHAKQKTLANKIALFQQELFNANIVSTSSERSPIQFIEIGSIQRTLDLVVALKNEGFFTSAAAFPAVPRTESGVRIAINNHLLDNDIVELVSAIKKYKVESP